MLKKIKLLKYKKALVFFVVLCVIAGGYFIFGGGNDVPQKAVTVSRGDVVEEVSVTGKVVPAKSINLAFEKSGRITRISAQVGNNVVRGEILAQLENGDLSAHRNAS